VLPVGSRVERLRRLRGRKAPLDAIAFLKQEHAKAKAEFQKLEQASRQQRGQLSSGLKPEPEVYEQIAEAGLYGPAAKEAPVMVAACRCRASCRRSARRRQTAAHPWPRRWERGHAPDDGAAKG
jgi:hypothetical protein